MEQDSTEAPDPITEMTREAVEGNTGTLEGTVSEAIHRHLDRDPTAWSEVTHRVMRGVVEGLHKSPDADGKLRRASEAAVLTVAKRWGNVVLAGKATVLASREAASAVGINSARAAEQASLGAAEGVMRVGPVAFPVLQRELSPLVDNFDVLFARSRNLPAVVEEKPIIVEQAPEETSHESFDASDDHAADAPVVEDYSARSPFAPRPEAPSQDFLKQRLQDKIAQPVPPKVGFFGRLVARVKGWFSKKS